MTAASPVPAEDGEGREAHCIPDRCTCGHSIASHVHFTGGCGLCWCAYVRPSVPPAAEHTDPT